ncbi:MAG: CDP-diacylglycerol--glycerol-3-phosphate 3-phosphatidyltransferase [Ruminococcaceae bacterium]|nr:CDP-diacylglycerol--glycerol-3-phosphate 3-phosphatidyltransferase [Oscillospiraceae bacterium]
MNLPNKLTILRMCLIPVFLFFMLVSFIHPIAQRIIAAALFVGTAITDMLDGKIARKYNLITDFGKFLDPLADKLMVFGAFLGLIYMYRNDKIFCLLMVIASFVVIFRELAVTSLRMVANNASGIVIAANWMGKVKTVSQIVFVMCVLLEPVVLGDFLGYFIPFFRTIADMQVLSYASMAFMVLMTLWSGINYFKAYFPHIDPRK